MSRSKIFGRLAAGAAALVLAAAAGLSGPSPASAADLQMWERSGGNKGMVDTLVAMWNEKNPDRKIKLTYIPHAEMVAKLAQAIASGEVPDLMGLDLIYGPQFEAAGQLVDITDYFKDDPTLKTASPGHMTVGTYRRIGSTACRSTPTCRRSSTTRTCSRRPGSTRTSRRRAWPKSAPMPTRSRRSAATSKATSCRAPAPAATSSPSAR